jgi:hypothetical protein
MVTARRTPALALCPCSAKRSAIIAGFGRASQGWRSEGNAYADDPFILWIFAEKRPKIVTQQAKNFDTAIDLSTKSRQFGSFDITI